jgi:ribosomal-protein-alanine N-acetyltransferase
MLSHEFPEFSLQRVKLRRIRQADVEMVFAGLSNPEVIKHYGVSYTTLASTGAQMRWFEEILQERSGIWWAIARCDDDSMIGACGFNNWSHTHRNAELGYWLLPDYWGQGLLTAALPLVLRYGFDHMRLHRIHAEVEPENAPSCALLKKLGFYLEGTLRDVELKDGKFLSLYQYSMLSSDPSASGLLS